MKRLTGEELNEILGLHVKWLRGEPDGVRAKLIDVDLSMENLSGIDLTNACLKKCNIRKFQFVLRKYEICTIRGCEFTSCKFGLC